MLIAIANAILRAHAQLMERGAENAPAGAKCWRSTAAAEAEESRNLSPVRSCSAIDLII